MVFFIYESAYKCAQARLQYIGKVCPMRRMCMHEAEPSLIICMEEVIFMNYIDLHCDTLSEQYGLSLIHI